MAIVTTVATKITPNIPPNIQRFFRVSVASSNGSVRVYQESSCLFAMAIDDSLLFTQEWEFIQDLNSALGTSNQRSVRAVTG